MRKRLIALTLLIAGAAVVADSPATQPDAPPANAEPRARKSQQNGDGRPRPGQRFMDGLRNFRGGMGGPGGQGGPRGFGGFGGPMMDLSHEAPPTDEEWQKITEFSQENFPNRWKLFERVREARGDDAPIIQAVKLRFAVRYRQLMKVQDDDSVFQAAMSLGKQEDNAWGISQALQNDPNNEQLKDQLHDAVATMVRSQLDERGRRLQAAREALDAEQSRYDDQRQNIERIVAMRSDRLASGAADFNLIIPSTQPTPTTNPAN